MVELDPDLAEFVISHCFEYDSPKMQPRVTRQIPEIDDIADQLWTYLVTNFTETQPSAGYS